MTEWGPWIEHDGKGIPAPVGTFMHLVSKSGYQQFGYVKPLPPRTGYFCWKWVVSKYGHDAHCVARYRIRRKNAAQILESILSEVDAPVREVTV